MRSVTRCGVWAAAMLMAMGAAVLAQEAPPAKPAPAKAEGQDQREKIGELNQRINKMVVEAAQANPELKALHEAQQAKWREANKKRMELAAANPEIKKLQDDIEAQRKKERDMAEETIAKNPELAEMQKQFTELREKFDAKRREVLAASPEIAAARKETTELQGKMFQATKDLPELKGVYAEADAAWNEMVKKAAEVSPEIAKAIAERDALMEKAGPAPAPAPAEKPKAKEEAK